jgi:hypothetical protein
VSVETRKQTKHTCGGEKRIVESNTNTTHTVQVSEPTPPTTSSHLREITWLANVLTGRPMWDVRDPSLNKFSRQSGRIEESALGESKRVLWENQLKGPSKAKFEKEERFDTLPHFLD